MKVLMVSKNLIVNGISSVILNYLSAMDLSDIQIDLVCGLPADKERLERVGVNVIVLKDRDKRPFKYYKNFSQLMKHGNYDIFHLHTNKMIEIAERLSKDFIFARINLYNVEGKIYFGEITLSPNSGFYPDITYDTGLMFGKKLKIPYWDCI